MLRFSPLHNAQNFLRHKQFFGGSGAADLSPSVAQK
jgi:hypothetical protein